MSQRSPLSSLNPSPSSQARSSRKALPAYLDLIGWDGIAFLLNVVLLALNLREHLRYRESPAAYEPVQAEAIYLLSESEVAALNPEKPAVALPSAGPADTPGSTPAGVSASPDTPGTPASAPVTSTTPAAVPTPAGTTAVATGSALPASPPGAPAALKGSASFQSLSKPLSTPSSPVITLPGSAAALPPGSAGIPPAAPAGTPSIPLNKPDPVPSTILPSVKVLDKVASALPAKTAGQTTPARSCVGFGPLTYNRLQQLQKQWKVQHPALPFTWTTTQPLHHYSVIFPALSTSATETRRLALSEANFKQHEVWTEGRGGVIVVGSFEDEGAAQSLIQRLHEKGFRESYMLVRTSPSVYWLTQTDELKSWLNQPSIARAQGIAWKAVPCPVPAATSTVSPSTPSARALPQ